MVQNAHTTTSARLTAALSIREKVDAVTEAKAEVMMMTTMMKMTIAASYRSKGRFLMQARCPVVTKDLKARSAQKKADAMMMTTTPTTRCGTSSLDC